MKMKCKMHHSHLNCDSYSSHKICQSRQNMILFYFFTYLEALKLSKLYCPTNSPKAKKNEFPVL